MRQVERRYRAGPSTVEVRASATGGGPVIAGYAAVFDSPSEDMGFVETIDPAAFRKSLADGADVRALLNHDVNQLLGRVKSGTLRLATDQRGLGYEIDVNQNDPIAVGVLERVRRGDLDGSSFGFQAISDSWDMTATPPQRRLLEARLLDVGPVTYPAYTAASSEARQILDAARLARSPRRVRAQAELDLLGLRAGVRAGTTPGGVDRPGPASVGALARRVELLSIELRVGKTISKATAQVLLDVVDKLEKLLEAEGAVDEPDAA